jgi:hypothetical protein
MATDEEYTAFLEKANADPNEGYVKTQNKSKAGGSVSLRAVDEGEAVPISLKEAVRNKIYVSDADEPFEVVCLRMPGGEKGPERKGEGMPDEGMYRAFPFKFMNTSLFRFSVVSPEAHCLVRDNIFQISFSNI